MERRKRQQPEHESPHEQRLREVVDTFVRDDSQKQAYLAFAHELTAAERRPYTVHRVIPTKPIRQAQGRLRAGRNLAAKQAGRDPSFTLGVTGAAERHAPFELVIPREQGDSRNLAARETGRDPSIGVGVTNGRDPSQRIKRIVAKWFGRGLSGHKLWLIGEALLRNPDSGTAFSELCR